MKVLVVVSEPITGEHLRSALGPEDAESAEVMVIAPALHTSALRFFMSDADEAIEKAEAVERESAAQLRYDDFIVQAADTAESDISEAVSDALVTFPAARVVLFVRSPESERYREHVDPEVLESELGLPVARFVLERSGAAGKA